MKQLLLLGVLLDGKMHGYRLNEHVRHAMGLYADITRPTVYYTLQKLEKDGYVRQEAEREGRRPERRVFQITENGKTFFFDLLRKHLSSFARTYYVDDIGIAYMGQLPAAETRRLLAEKREKIRAILQQFAGLPEHGGNWQYVIRHNIAHLKTDLAWVNSIIDKMDSD